ncbi:MAG: hypothetical protein AB1384_10320 [Actinomycetota bacterium]
MATFKRCEECGVPEQIAVERQWLNSGVVVQRGNIMQRTGFIESANLGPLYAGIAEIIGIPIDNLIVESTRKGGGRYVRGILPPQIQEAVRDGSLALEPIIAVLLATAEVSGYGRCEQVGLRYDTGAELSLEAHAGDFVTLRIENPYSIAPVVGVFTGATEAVTGLPFRADYQETGANTYDIKISVGEHAIESGERLEAHAYDYREGDIVLEPCSTCGLPRALAAYKWDDDQGTITDTRKGRRMVGVGPYVMDPLFKELEEELGDAIPRAVVESQRRFVKSGFYSVDEVRDFDAFRAELALKGMGNLRELELGPEGLRMRIENADCYLMMVGLMQGIFELARGVDSEVEWELSQEGDLQIQVTPKK